MRRSSDQHGPPGRSVNRRDLFRLRPPREQLAAEATYDLLNVARPAMGSYFEIKLPTNVPGAADLASRALDIIDDVEGQLTVYRDDSEVARINAEAHLRPMTVEPELFGLLERAVELWRETGGAYDLTTGALSLAWGFTRGPRRLPDPESLAIARDRTGSQHLRLDPVGRTIAFDRPGLVLNFGSLGKGYAIDRAVALLRAHWYPTAGVVHGGRSSLYALGSPPDQFGGRWSVALRNPLEPEAPVGLVRLRNRGMGTSGAAFQRFEEGGRVYGHLIDPRTGEPPADGPLSVTVLAPTAAEADALSTAFYLLGPEATATYVADHPEVGVIMLVPGVDPARPDLLTWGVTDADFVATSRPETLSLRA
jgi:thiamine biosynthesis lipoprotein